MKIALAQAEERLCNYPGYGSYGPHSERRLLKLQPKPREEVEKNKEINMMNVTQCETKLERAEKAAKKAEEKAEVARQKVEEIKRQQEAKRENKKGGVQTTAIVSSASPNINLPTVNASPKITAMASEPAPTTLVFGPHLPAFYRPYTWKLFAQDVMQHAKPTATGTLSLQCCGKTKPWRDFCHEGDYNGETKCERTQENWKRMLMYGKLAKYLVGLGFHEVMQQRKRHGGEVHMVASEQGTMRAAEKRAKEKRRMREAVQSAAEIIVRKSIQELQDNGVTTQWTAEEFLQRRRKEKEADEKQTIQFQKKDGQRMQNERNQSFMLQCRDQCMECGVPMNQNESSAEGRCVDCSQSQQRLRSHKDCGAAKQRAAAIFGTNKQEAPTDRQVDCSAALASRLGYLPAEVLRFADSKQKATQLIAEMSQFAGGLPYQLVGGRPDKKRKAGYTE